MGAVSNDPQDNYTIPQLLDHHCKHSAKHISIITPNTCYSLADRAFAAYRGVAYLHESLQGLEPGSTVAFLAGEWAVLSVAVTGCD